MAAVTLGVPPNATIDDMPSDSKETEENWSNKNEP